MGRRYLSAQTTAPSDLFVGINRSNILENNKGVKRISIANPEVAEAVAVSKTEVLINGKAAGDTSLVLWDLQGQRSMFDVHVTLSDARRKLSEASSRVNSRARTSASI